MAEYFVGLMSGTSMDGIDAVLVRFADRRVDIAATHHQAYAETLRFSLHRAATTSADEPLENIGSLDRQVGECFRDAARAVMEQGSVRAADIRAIGSHGQTVRHQPGGDRPYSLQIGNPDIIASGTGITTVADFRTADIAAGGQGAPLVPPFHDWLFRSRDESRIILNIGGIANVTVLPRGDAPVTGFDTGPGNTLMDGWIRRHRGRQIDEGGGWAAAGTVLETLLDRMLDCGYFRQEPPKSTGLEDFNLDWLSGFGIDRYDPADVQATLCELTARSVALQAETHAADARSMFVCGGGAHNRHLLQRLARNLPHLSIASTSAVGLDPDWVEAVAFAWLAMRTMNNEPGNLPSVTGASRKVVLGTIHSP